MPIPIDRALTSCSDRVGKCCPHLLLLMPPHLLLLQWALLLLLEHLKCLLNAV
jgi:hypothetical protein